MVLVLGWALFFLLGTLLAMLVTWLAQGRPKYVSQEGSIAYISDVGADILKPLFVTGCIITGLSFFIALSIERWLRHSGRWVRILWDINKVWLGSSFFLFLFVFLFWWDRRCMWFTRIFSPSVLLYVPFCYGWWMSGSICGLWVTEKTSPPVHRSSRIIVHFGPSDLIQPRSIRPLLPPVTIRHLDLS